MAGYWKLKDLVLIDFKPTNPSLFHLSQNSIPTLLNKAKPMSAPFPRGLFLKISDLIPTNNLPCLSTLSPPRPNYVFFKTPNELPNISTPPTPIEEPYPRYTFIKTNKNLKLYGQDIDYFGTFKNCVDLEQVSIPETVKYIGPYAFENTKLKKVVLAADCQYYPTSFPSTCEVVGGTIINKVSL